MKLLKIFIVTAAAVTFLATCSQPQNSNSPGAVTQDPPAKPVDSPLQQSHAKDDGQTLAKELYAVNCMICHKEDGTGGKVTMNGKTIEPENLTEEKFKKATDEKLIGYVTNGIPDEGMPAFKEKLTTDQIEAIVGHVRLLQK